MSIHANVLVQHEVICLFTGYRIGVDHEHPRLLRMTEALWAVEPDAAEKEALEALTDWEWKEYCLFFKHYTKGVEEKIQQSYPDKLTVDCPKCAQPVHLEVVEDSAELVSILAEADSPERPAVINESNINLEGSNDTIEDSREAEISVALIPDCCPNEGCGAALGEVEIELGVIEIDGERAPHIDRAPTKWEEDLRADLDERHRRRREAAEQSKWGAEEREWRVREAAESAELEKHELKVADERRREAVEAYNQDVEQPTRPCTFDYCDGQGLINIDEPDGQLCGYCLMTDHGISAHEQD